jgi:multisubunit Na+/H+ antiporter MnhF subunit
VGEMYSDSVLCLNAVRINRMLCLLFITLCVMSQAVIDFILQSQMVEV